MINLHNQLYIHPTPGRDKFNETQLYGLGQKLGQPAAPGTLLCITTGCYLPPYFCYLVDSRASSGKVWFHPWKINRKVSISNQEKLYYLWILGVPNETRN